MKLLLDRIGSIGMIITAIATPCCFPFFAFILSVFGFGSVELFGGWTKYIFEGLVLLSLIGLYIAYKQHKNIFPLLIGLVSGGFIIYAYNLHFDSKTIYVGIFGTLLATGLNYYNNRRYKITCATCTLIEDKTVVLQSTITCPNCGHKKTETMPTNACQFFYECEQCKSILKPKQGDCCVYCSYGTVKCPSIQTGEECC